MFLRSSGKISNEEFKKILQKCHKHKLELDNIIKKSSEKEIVRAIHELKPNLFIKEKKKTNYDKHDKLYIKHLYSNVRDYDSDLSDEESSNDDYDTPEVLYFRRLEPHKKKKIVDTIQAIKKETKANIPLNIQIINSNLTHVQKSLIFYKLENTNEMNNDKLMLWVRQLLHIPFKTYCDLPVTIHDSKKLISSFLMHTKKTLDKVVYGHVKPKNKLLQIVTNMITNPISSGHVFGIQGPMGNGKTTLLKYGLSKILKRPFHIIPLGGSTDSSNLVGHSFTYEGSQCGEIANILMKSKCMNPIIYFDELDKVSETAKGKEIIGILTHLTDNSQNQQFHDRYFAGIDLDLSKAIIVFSFNDIRKINKILLDRIDVIKTKGYKIKDKINICKQFLIPDICKNINFNPKHIIFSDSLLQYIIKNFTQEEGVRDLKRCLLNIISKINVLQFVDKKDFSEFNIPSQINNLKLPITITEFMVDSFTDRQKIQIPLSMYS